MSSPAAPAESPHDVAWLFKLWFGFSEPVTRGRYLASGLMLMSLKYCVDAASLRLLTGQTWTVESYLTPLLHDRQVLSQTIPTWAMWAWIVWSLPFAWVGLSMSLRRAKDAGLTPWAGLVFLVPFANYLMMVALSALGSRPGTPAVERAGVVRARSEHRFRSALSGAAAGVAFAVAMLVLSVFVFRTYGATLFLGTPLAMGLVSAYIQNRSGADSVVSTLGVSALTAIIAGGTVMLFALEGGVCVAMAIPPALVGTTVGALAGRSLALQRVRSLSAASLVALLPFGNGLETSHPSTAQYEAMSSVEVNASPEKVWSMVVTFPPLSTPTEWMFQIGVSYPKGARIEGQGVGATRYCDFSTGSFVEPITRWEPPNLLAFDVTAQPVPMEEWSPYKQIHPPHLDGYFRSTRGEFRLIPLGDGRTRLEGRTWYALDLAPTPYWKLWADYVVHAIHHRVLEHIRARSEADR